jgi:hypothetical protein
LPAPPPLLDLGGRAYRYISGRLRTEKKSILLKYICEHEVMSSSPGNSLLQKPRGKNR